MKYKHHSMLPIGSFARRGSVVGGRSVRLHGDSDDWWSQPETQEDPNQYFVTTNNESGAGYYVPAPAPAPPPPPPPPQAPAPAPAPAPSAPAAPAGPSRNDTIWQQVNDIYVQELGRNADPGGHQSFYDLLASGQLSIEGARNAMRGSAEYQQKNPAAAAPAYTPFAEDQFGYGTDQASSYANAARLANWHMSRGDPHGYAQQFIDQANDLKTHLSNPYRIDTITSGSGGDAGTNTETVLVTPGGNVPVVQDEQGQYVANIIGSGSGESGGSNTTGATIQPQEIAKQEEAAKSRPFGTGFGQALGYEYGLKNSSGDLFQKYDAKGNLTEYLDRDGKWQKTSDVKPVGTQFNPETGQLDTVYSYSSGNYGENPYIVGDYVPGMSKFHEDQGGFLGEGGWSRMAGLVAAGLSAGVAGGAFAGLGIGTAPGALTAAQAASLMGVESGLSLAAIGTAATQGALTSVAMAGLQGASPQDMLKAGLTGAVSAGIGSALSTAGLSSFQQAAARVATQTGMAAASGADIEKALVNSIVSAALPAVINNALPKETLDALNSMPESARKVLMSTLTNSLNAGIQGQDISDAAIRGVTSGLTSVAKDFATGAFKDFKESDFAKSFSKAFGSDYEEFQELPPGVFEQKDDLAALLAKDAQEAIDRNKPVTTPTTPPITDNEASIVDQFNTNPPAASFPVAPPKDFNLSPLAPGLDLIDGGLADERAKGIFERYRPEWTKVASDANTIANLVGGTLSSGLGLVKSLNAETENFIKSLMTGEEFNKLTQAQQDKIYTDSAAVFEKINDLVFKAVGVDAASDEAKSGVLTQAIEKAGEIIKPYIQSISDATGLNTQYVEAGLSVIVPSVLGKTVNTIGKVTDDIKAGGWKDAFENTIDLARNKGIIPNDRFNFIGEGNVLYKVDADTPALSSSKLDQFNTGKLPSNDPVFKLADTYKIDPKVAATIIDSSVRLGVPVSTAIGLGLVDNTGNISPIGDTFLNPPPNLGEPQPDLNPEPAPDLVPAPDVTPVIRPEQPANDPVVNPADPANDPVFVPPEPETPTAPTPDEEPTRPIVPILPPVTPEAPVIPDTGNPDLDEILSPTPISPTPAPETSPAPTPVAPPVQDPDAPPAPVSPPVTPTYPTDQPSPSTQPKSEADFAAALRALQEKIAANEAAGMGRNEAFSSAVTGLGTQLGGLGNQIGGINQNLTGLQQGLAGLSEGFGAYQAANAKEAAAKQKQEQGQQILNILGQQRTGAVKTPDPAKIDYLYDIGGESIFATPKQESLMPSPFEEAPAPVDGAMPRYQYYDYNKNTYNYADGGLIGGDDLQTIDDLYEMLRSK